MVRDPGFRAFTTRANGRANRLITDITVLPAFNPQTQPPPASTKQAKALWDTGATGSVISAQVATELSLKPTGAVNVNHAGGSSVSPTYLVNFQLPHSVAVVGALVTEWPGATEFGVIVGMDIICHGDFSITNVNGETCFSFRTPAKPPAIDYVDQWNRHAWAGVSRNAPCPCGAVDGKGATLKFKACHGKSW